MWSNKKAPWESKHRFCNSKAKVPESPNPCWATWLKHGTGGCVASPINTIYYCTQSVPKADAVEQRGLSSLVRHGRVVSDPSFWKSFASWWNYSRPTCFSMVAQPPSVLLFGGVDMWNWKHCSVAGGIEACIWHLVIPKLRRLMHVYQSFRPFMESILWFCSQSVTWYMAYVSCMRSSIFSLILLS